MTQQINKCLSVLVLLILSSFCNLARANFCKKLFNNLTQININSEFGYGDAANKSDYVLMSNMETMKSGYIELNIKAEESDTPSIQLPNSGGVVGKPFINKKNANPDPGFQNLLKTEKYQNSLEPSVILIEKLNEILPNFLKSFLAQIDTLNVSPELTPYFYQLVDSMVKNPSKIELSNSNDSIFKGLPADRIAATRIGDLGSPIYLNIDMLRWGDFRQVNIKTEVAFGGSAMGRELREDLERQGDPRILQYTFNDKLMEQNSSIEGLMTWFGILLHEKAHQIGLKDNGNITPDQLAVHFQQFVKKQIIEHRVEIKDDYHPWLKVIQILPQRDGWKGDLLMLDGNGVRSLTPDILEWLNQAYENKLNAKQVWFENLRVKASSKWDIFSLSSPFILQGELMIEKFQQQVGEGKSTVVKRDAELILFFGSEDKVANVLFNRSSWTDKGENPELIYGPKHESLVQLRLMPAGTNYYRGEDFMMSAPYPNLKVHPGESWKLFLKSDNKFPEGLEPVSVSFNIRPSQLRHNVWFRERAPIQIEGRWEMLGGQILLHGEFKPQKAVVPGSYSVDSIYGIFLDKYKGKNVSLEIKTNNVMTIEVTASQTSTIAGASVYQVPEPLVLKRFGTYMVKEISREDDIRWLSLDSGFELTWKDNNKPLSQPEKIAGWVPVPFVFNRTVQPKNIWLHGTATVRDTQGKEFSFLYSGLLEELSAMVKFSRVYQNSANETVMELKIHYPLKLNGFRFVRWNIAGMTVIEENLQVSYQRLQFYFGEQREKQD